MTGVWTRLWLGFHDLWQAAFAVAAVAARKQVCLSVTEIVDGDTFTAQVAAVVRQIARRLGRRR